MIDLAPLIGDVARHLLGEPNKSLTTRSEIRFGAKGSMSVDLKKGTWYDWEADEGGGVVDLVVRECALPSREAAFNWLRTERYLDARTPMPSKKKEQPAQEARAAASRLDYAMDIWRFSVSGANTPVETYLKSRAIMIAVPGRLHYAAALPHKNSGQTWPAMIALVTRGVDDAPIAIHRTWLARDGAGKAPVEPNKMGLGSWRGGAVKFAPPAAHLLVGEGIETCLSAMQVTGIGAWAALSTSGLMNLELPPEVRRITVLADHDPVNKKTGTRPGEAAARAAAARWKRQGRDARIAVPPEEGTDFNDMLMREVQRVS